MSRVARRARLSCHAEQGYGLLRISSSTLPHAGVVGTLRDDQPTVDAPPDRIRRQRLMPEGDTIAKSARTLAGALVGRTVTGFRATVPAAASAARQLGVVGSEVTAVEAQGKHLLMRFSSGAVLRTHLQMTGSWHLYRVGSRWQKPERYARVVVDAGDVVAVCFSAPVVEVMSERKMAAHPVLRRLGPDLLADDYDQAVAFGRLRSRGDEEIAVALLDQSVVAGIGNVYKSEILFLHGVDPFARVGRLDDNVLRDLLATARREMQRTVAGGGERRTNHTLGSAPLWVYGRDGKPCLRCGTPIRRALQGEQRRSTYWCPRCQPARGMEATSAAH